MRKKGIKKTFSLLTIIFVFLLTLFFPLQVSASGTFSCKYSNWSNKCEVSVDNCVWSPPGDCQYPNFLQCMSVTDPFVCDSFINQGCVDITGACAPGDPKPTPPGSVTCSGDEIPTAIGCIDVTSPSSVVESIMTLFIGIGSGIAFLLVILGSFQVLTSSGSPDKIQAGKELIVSAITGLLLIVFAVFVLRLIGARILQIPGFG